MTNQQLAFDDYRYTAVIEGLCRFVDRIAAMLLSVGEEVTLVALADYTQLSLEREPREEFTTWEFAVYQTPRILERLSREQGAVALDELLADGEYMTVVRLVASEIFTSEQDHTTSD
jgi:hypothetical protein